MYIAVHLMYMLLSGRERRFLEAISRLAYCNPFLPEREEHERAALGRDFIEGEPIWSLTPEDPERRRANVWRIAEILDPLAETLRQRLSSGDRPNAPELQLYEDAIFQLLYHRHHRSLHSSYRTFFADWNHFFDRFPPHAEPVHIFACLSQIHHAF